MALAEFLSGFLPTAKCDAPEDKQEEKPKGEEAEAEEEAEEEEEEPQDPLEELREECKESASCAKFTRHFEHCQEKVEAGEGFKGEDCVEEMFHMMHCVDNCVAPKLFAKLK